MPPTVTTMSPVIAPLGTGTTMPVEFQLVGAAVIDPKRTELTPWLDPKFVPMIVTVLPTAPEPGVTLEMAGVAVLPSASSATRVQV